MNVKLKYLFIVLLMVMSVLASCSGSLSDRQDSLSSTPSDLPLLLPTHTLAQPAEINPGKFIGTVYISDHDNDFHTSGCPNLTTNVRPVPREGALIQGFTACPLCKP
jgi:hypothetical protein